MISICDICVCNIRYVRRPDERLEGHTCKRMGMRNIAHEFLSRERARIRAVTVHPPDYLERSYACCVLIVPVCTGKTPAEEGTYENGEAGRADKIIIGNNNHKIIFRSCSCCLCSVVAVFFCKTLCNCSSYTPWERD